MPKNTKDTKYYTPKEAVQKIKESSKTKFDAMVEVHVNLRTDVKKQDQNIRFSITLPHGTGKTKKVAVLSSNKVANADLELTESDIAKLENGEIRPKVDFDILITEPKYMPKIAKAAKVLGPAGVMPSPKTGTVTENIEQALNQVKKGKFEVRNEKDAPIIHTIIGKVSFDNKQLEENLNEFITVLKNNKPPKTKPDWIKNIFITSTMGPSFLIDLGDIN